MLCPVMVSPRKYDQLGSASDSVGEKLVKSCYCWRDSVWFWKNLYTFAHFPSPRLS